MLLATLLAAAAAAVLLGRPTAGLHRLPQRGRGTTRPRTALSAGVACGVCGVGAAALVGLPAGLPVGVAMAVLGPLLVARLEPAASRQEREQLVRDLPLVLDLLAACLAGGASLRAAAAVVGEAVGGPCGDRLLAVHAALSVGTAPEDAWLLLSGPDREDLLAPTARLLARAADGGTPIATAVGRLAADSRAASVAVAQRAARRAGVLVVAPLGLCFLPAFVLLGIVPVVAGLAGPMLRSL